MTFFVIELCLSALNDVIHARNKWPTKKLQL